MFTAGKQGRAAGFDPPNRFERSHLEPLDIDLDAEEGRNPRTIFLKDTSRSVLAKNDSPDLPFDYSINPYRGCEHGCIYCYARPSHEYLGFSAGLDFETKIMVKMDAPDLLTRELMRRSWKPQMVAFSGNTDCYQPIERKLGITRRCLEVFLSFRNPVGIITKNALIQRDVDVLMELSKRDLVHVAVSITTLDDKLARCMEPRTSTPEQRLGAIQALSAAGIPVGVNVAPIIPGLTDEEIPSILQQAKDHGATYAGCILLRLPGAVEPLFIDWLSRVIPGKEGRVLNRIRETRDGELSDPRFGSRMTGTGALSKNIRNMFDVFAARAGLSTKWNDLSITNFRRRASHQLDFFE